MSKAKVINLGDSNIPQIKNDTTQIATAINSMMTGLQAKYPDYYFDLDFERQRIGKQIFYRIHLKTFNNNGK